MSDCKQCPACNSLVEYDVNMKEICSFCQTEELAGDALEKEKADRILEKTK